MKKFINSLILFLTFQHAIGQDLQMATLNCEFLIEKKVHVKYGLNFDLNQESEEIRAQWANDAFRHSKFEAACEAVAGQVKLINADVIGLTEIGKDEDLDVFMSKLSAIGASYPYKAVCKSSDVSTGQHVVVLSRYPLSMIKESFKGRALYFNEADLDESDDTGISKGLHVQVLANGKTIELFVIHLKSERGGYEDDAQRLAQAEIVRRELIPLLSDPERLVVVMGDLNSEKRHETLLRIRGFDDVYPELIQTGDDNYFSDFSTRWTYQFKGEKEQIDHILLSYGFQKLCKSNGGIRTSILETNDALISDHNGVKVALTYR